MKDTSIEYYRDVFLSHASIDKKSYILPFAQVLEQQEISYWLDESELEWGKSLLQQISVGMNKSRYVIVFISDEFLSRNWPQAELRTALNEEISTGELKVLPIIICDTNKCLKEYPFLRDKKYINWSADIYSMVKELGKALGRSYESEWSFTYPPEFRGHIWIKIIPKPENILEKHNISIDWGRWRYTGELEFKEDKSIILDFKKIVEDNTWPIEFKISPSAFVVSGKGNPVIDINKGWKCIDEKGLARALVNRGLQSLLPDTKDENARIKPHNEQ